jgi:CHAD domain-containing protein
MRVSSRRLRSALRDFAPYLPKKISAKSLRKVAQALGAVRDEDVAILMMEKLGAEAGVEVSAGIELLMEERRRRREPARDALKKAITETALNELQEKFGAELERATRKSGGKKARAKRESGEELRFHNVGAEIILARFQELEGMSSSLYQPFNTEPLHRMRIAAKRLRYSIELHTQCWGEELTPFAKEVGKLQESLGELHDCDVWLEQLGARLETLQRSDKGDGKTSSSHSPEQRAALWLLQHFVKDRTRHFKNALALWDTWETTNFSQRLSETLEGLRGSLETQTAETSPDEQTN